MTGLSMLEEPNVAAPHGRFLGYMRRSAVYVLGPVAGRVLGLLLVPFVLAALGPDDFGRYEILSTAGTALASILLLGMDLSSISLFHRPAPHRASQVHVSALALAAGVSAVLISTVWFFRSSLAELWVDEADRTVAASLVGVYAAATLLGLVGRAALRATDQAARHSIAVAVTSIATAACTALVLWSGATLDTIMVAQVGGAVGGAGLALFYARRLFTGRPQRAVTKSLMVLGLPQLVAMVALWGGELLHRLIVLSASGPAEVASLGVGARIATALGFVVIGMQAAWHPRVFAQLADEDHHNVGRDARRVAALLSLAAVAVSLLSSFGVQLLAGDRFDNAVGVAGWMTVAVMGTGFVQIGSLYTITHRRFNDAALAMVLGTGAGLAVSALAVGTYGAVGAAAGMAATQWAAALLGFVMARRRGLLVLPAARVLFPALVAIPVCVFITTNDSNVTRAAAAVASIVVSVGVLVTATVRATVPSRR